MRTEKQIELAAAAAAEKANGGKFADPLFYKPEHQAFWREVIRTAFDAADAASAPAKEAASKVSLNEVQEFSDHCVYIRSVYRFTMRIFRDSDESERKNMEDVAPSTFEDLAQVLREYIIISACRVTDAAKDRRDNENFTVELFLNSFPPESETYKQLHELTQRMGKLRTKILPARHKLAAHADREAIRSGKPLGMASFQEWDEFWSTLRDFVRILNEKKIGRPFEIDAGGVLGDAEMLLKAFAQSRHFGTLLNGNDPAVRDACLKLALPNP